jgi:hypothetical protein
MPSTTAAHVRERIAAPAVVVDDLIGHFANRQHTAPVQEILHLASALVSYHDLTIAPDNVGGHDIVGDEPLTLRVELWRKLGRAPTAESGLLLTLAAGPLRQRSVVQRADGGTRRNPRRRRRTLRLFKHAECCSRNCREGEHRRLAPKDLGGGDRCPRHDLDLSVDARLMRVDLQEHIADAH